MLYLIEVLERGSTFLIEAGQRSLRPWIVSQLATAVTLFLPVVLLVVVALLTLVVVLEG
jgi:hypothetical protein